MGAGAARRTNRMGRTYAPCLTGRNNAVGSATTCRRSFRDAVLQRCGTASCSRPRVRLPLGLRVSGISPPIRRAPRRFCVTSIRAALYGPAGRRDAMPFQIPRGDLRRAARAETFQFHVTRRKQCEQDKRKHNRKNTPNMLPFAIESIKAEGYTIGDPADLLPTG